MNLYKLTYLIKPELTSDEVKEFNQELTDELKEANATLYKMEQPKKRNLAYEVKGFTEGYIACIDMDIASEQVKLIEEKLKRKDEILRHLIVSKEKLEEEEEPEEGDEEEGDDEPEKDSDDEKEEEGDDEDKEENKNKKEDKVKLNEIDEKIDEII